jgi:hypothetical protein
MENNKERLLGFCEAKAASFRYQDATACVIAINPETDRKSVTIYDCNYRPEAIRLAVMQVCTMVVGGYRDYAIMVEFAGIYQTMVWTNGTGSIHLVRAARSRGGHVGISDEMAGIQDIGLMKTGSPVFLAIDYMITEGDEAIQKILELAGFLPETAKPDEEEQTELGRS